MSQDFERCRVCASNEGVERISPGRVIYEGKYWLVEHAYPSSLLGWLVIVLRRHAEALHELTREEGRELGALQRAAAITLGKRLGCLKEYSACFAEGPGFAHIHFHVVPRATEMEERLRAGGIFEHLKSPAHPVPPEAVRELCDELAELVPRNID